MCLVGGRIVEGGMTPYAYRNVKEASFFFGLLVHPVDVLPPAVIEAELSFADELVPVDAQVEWCFRCGWVPDHGDACGHVGSVVKLACHRDGELRDVRVLPQTYDLLARTG